MALTFEVLGRRHLDWLMNLRNQNRKWFMNSEEITFDRQCGWFKNSSESGDLNLVMVDPDSYDRIGFISLYQFNGGGATIGRMMTDDKFKHQGYMEKAMIKVFTICTHILGLHSLTLEVKRENLIACDLYVKMGFTTIGITQHTYIMRKIF